MPLKLPSKEKFVITIGDFGSVVALYDGDKLLSNLFLENLDEEAKTKLNVLFNKHKSPSITILLDNLDQTYRKKTYPLINAINLKNIAKREMESDGDKTSFKNYIPFIPKKSSGLKKSECLFVSISKSDLVDRWLQLLLDLPNHVTGVYSLPVESFKLFSLLNRRNIESTKTSHKLHCLIFQTKVGGIRQVVYSERGIVFTRIVNYNFEESDWIEKYEEDIYSTFEYLKRSFLNINITQLYITNILEEKICNQIKGIQDSKLNFINHTPSQASTIAGCHGLLTRDEEYSDLLISKVFSKEKKTLKFTTPQIVSLERFFIILQSSYFLNAGLLIFTLVTFLSMVILSDKTKSVIKESKHQRVLAVKSLDEVKNLAAKEKVVSENSNSWDIERIIDFGTVNKALQEVGKSPLESYSELKFLQNYNIILSKFSYSLSKFNYKNPKKNSTYNISVNGIMPNEGGDIDDLFDRFDNVSNMTKKSLKNYKVYYTEIPRSIDFTKKYYSYPIKFLISSKK